MNRKKNIKYLLALFFLTQINCLAILTDMAVSKEDLYKTIQIKDVGHVDFGKVYDFSFNTKYAGTYVMYGDFSTAELITCDSVLLIYQVLFKNKNRIILKENDSVLLKSNLVAKSMMFFDTPFKVPNKDIDGSITFLKTIPSNASCQFSVDLTLERLHPLLR